MRGVSGNRSVAEELHELAGAVRRLGPDRLDPERFYLPRGEIEDRLKEFAGQLEHISGADERPRRAGNCHVVAMNLPSPRASR